MGCASSSPLVQGGVDGVKQKAKAAAAEVEKMKDEAVDMMKDAGESVKEKIIELKDEVEDKVEALTGGGRESAEEVAAAGKELAGTALEEAGKEVEETAAAAVGRSNSQEVEGEEAEETKKEDEDGVEELKLEEVTTDELKSSLDQVESDPEKKTTDKTEAERPVDKILFIDILSDGNTMIVEELVIGRSDVDYSSRASTGRARDEERGFPSSELEEIKKEMNQEEEELGGDSLRRSETGDGSQTERVEAAKEDLAEEMRNMRECSAKSEDSLETDGMKTGDEESWKRKDSALTADSLEAWRKQDTPSPEPNLQLDKLEAARAELAEAEEEAREGEVEKASDRQRQEFLDEEKQLKEDEKFRIQVGSDAEVSHSPKLHPKSSEENNNDSKSVKNNDETSETIENPE